MTKIKVLKFIKSHSLFFLIAAVFTVLLLRNPFSTRTLIPNLEPFPDVFYYTTTPRCFLNGLGWKMCRLHNPELPGTMTAVPPAYSLSLLPGYMLHFDVRMFYFTNVVLAFISLFLLYKVALNFFKNQFITGFLLFLYVTNYFVYWYPTLAMAENLLQPLFLLSILLLQQKKISYKMSIAAGILAASFYGTKYAFAPLTITFPFVYLGKIWLQKIDLKTKIKHIAAAAIPGGLILFGLTGLGALLSVINQVTNGALDSNSSNTITSGGGYFSASYFIQHIQEYSYALLGKSQRFLWDSTPLTERWIALPALFGLFLSLRSRKELPSNKLVHIWLILATIAQLIFISFFYVVDIRYVYHFLPILLLGFGFFIQHLYQTLLKEKILLYSFLGMLFLVYFAGSAARLKSVVSVNLKYAETPWWYLSQLEMNRFFDNSDNFDNQTTTQSAQPILITLAAPYLTDNYTNGNYTTLPLDKQQDFRGSMQKVWGPNDYSDLIALYKQKISEGYQVYVTNYGVSAAGHFQQSYAAIEENFTLTEKQSGCYNLCNIYKLELPQ